MMNIIESCILNSNTTNDNKMHNLKKKEREKRKKIAFKT